MSPHRASMQKHFNTRAAERLGLRVNRHDVREYIDYLMAYKSQGIFAGWSRYWYYIRFQGVWSWVLLDREAKRLVTIITEPPRYQDEASIARAKAWGEGEKRPWA